MMKTTTTKIINTILFLLFSLPAFAGTAVNIPIRSTTVTPVGLSSNCELNVSANTITISGANGTALSASNPCLIGINSFTSSVAAQASFTSNVTVTGGASSQTDGNLWGITEANWANKMPMFIGIITDGTSNYFTLSRIPVQYAAQVAVDATDICQLDDTSCDGEADVMILASGLTLANWVNAPITQVAWVAATYATSGNAWTFSEDTNYQVGFNFNFERHWFAFPQAQKGAASGTHLLANSGTPPQCSTENYRYNINRHSDVKIDVDYASDGGTDGSGAVGTLLATPYARVASSGSTTIYDQLGKVNGATTITGDQELVGTMTEDQSYVTLFYVDSNSARSAITLAMFSNGSRTLGLQCSYTAYSSF